MTTLQEMHKRTTSSFEYAKMVQYARPLFDCLDINYFYYMRILVQDEHTNFLLLGTNLEWQEYLYSDPTRLSSWLLTIIPDKTEFKTGIRVFKDCNSPPLDIAWNNFGIKFSVCIQNKIDGGIESYGFGIKFPHPKAEEQLLNELSLLRAFISFFHKENKKLLNLASENQVDISSIISIPEGQPTKDFRSNQKKILLKQLGLESMTSLTRREIEILRFMAEGLSTRDIAHHLHLSTRTVENHLETIKSKLDCNSKAELIKKAQDIDSVINPLGYIFGVQEIEILKYLADGITVRDIANKLHLSHRTVENHIANIQSKLDCNSKAELINKAHNIIQMINPP